MNWRSERSYILPLILEVLLLVLLIVAGLFHLVGLL